MRTHDQLPPHSLEAEQAILGAFLLDRHKLHEALEVGISTLWFYDLRHQSLFDAMRAMEEKGLPLELVSLGQFLKDHQQLEGLGGLSYLGALTDCIPNANNLPYHLAIVREKADLRILLKAATGIVASITDNHSRPAEEVLAEAKKALDSHQGLGPTKTATLKQAIGNVLDDLPRRFELSQRSGGVTGVATGLRALDQASCGIQYGEFSMVAARPGVGKSALVLNVFRHAGLENKQKAVFLTLEMSEPQLAERMLADTSGIDGYLFRSGCIADPERYQEEKRRAITASALLAKSPLMIRDVRGQTIDMILAAMNRYVDIGVRFFILDYLQLVHAGGRHEKVNYMIGEVCEKLLGFVKRHNVALLSAVQLNRDSEKGEKTRMPKLGELKDSGSIEQFGEMIMLLHRDVMNSPNDATLLLAKQRQGPTGSFPLDYDGRIYRFSQREVRPE